jgi:hypothetical protein
VAISPDLFSLLSNLAHGKRRIRSADGGFRLVSEVVRNRRACKSVASRPPACSRETAACAVGTSVRQLLRCRRQLRVGSGNGAKRGTHSVKNSPELVDGKMESCVGSFIQPGFRILTPGFLHSRPRLLVASDTSIAEFHEFLQSAFDWSGEHLHRCLIHGQKKIVASQVPGLS